jgi:hypothetical protein
VGPFVFLLAINIHAVGKFLGVSSKEKTALGMDIYGQKKWAPE